MIAASSPYFSHLSVADAFALISREFEAWEVVAEGRHRLPDVWPQLKELTASKPLHLSAHAPMSDINIGSLSARMLEASIGEVEECLGACRHLDIRTCVVHPGFLTPLGFVDKEMVRSTTKASLLRLQRAAADAGVTIAFENMPAGPSCLAQTPDDLMRHIDGTDIMVCWDIGHANTMNLVDEFLSMRDRFVNIHAHDNMGRADEHLPVGTGTVDWPRTLKALSGYTGNYVVESRSLDDGIESKRRLSSMLTSRTGSR